MDRKADDVAGEISGHGSETRHVQRELAKRLEIDLGLDSGRIEFLPYAFPILDENRQGKAPGKELMGVAPCSI